jgi:hypothetical protein
MTLGFSNAELPSLIPLQRSHSENQIEAELKQLFLDLFRSKMATEVFDANVLGVPHLGSMNLVRRTVNADGLVLLQGDREEAATRYLYRAWKSRNAQGRGTHFLRTYLQMLFPNAFEVHQLWHSKDQTYPNGLVVADRPRAWWLHQLGESNLKLDGSWGVGRRIPDAKPSRADEPTSTDSLFLTSRLDIALDFSVAVPSIAGLLHIVRSIIPARLVPSFRFLMAVDVFASSAFVSSLLMRKSLSARLAWPGRVIGDGSDAVWRLGVGGSLLRLPKVAGHLKIGHFKLGERRGGISSWLLKSERIQSTAVMSSTSSLLTGGMPKVGDSWRRIDGSWSLGLRAIHASRSALISSRSKVDAEPSAQVIFSERIRLDLQGTPDRLGRHPKLTSWRRLDGRWSVGEVSRPFGFSLRLEEPIQIGSQALLEKRFDCGKMLSSERLVRPSAIKLARTFRRLDGSWFVGAENKVGLFKLDGRRLRANKLTTCHRLGGFSLSREIPGVSGYAAGLGRSLRLDGGWFVGRIAGPEVIIKMVRAQAA